MRIVLKVFWNYFARKYASRNHSSLVNKSLMKHTNFPNTILQQFLQQKSNINRASVNIEMNSTYLSPTVHIVMGNRRVYF